MMKDMILCGLDGEAWEMEFREVCDIEVNGDDCHKCLRLLNALTFADNR